MSTSHATTMPRPSRTNPPRVSPITVLIEVPAVDLPRRASRRFDAAAGRAPANRPRLAQSRPGGRPGKRRLRREIRVTARVCLGLAIVIGSGTLYNLTRPGAAAATALGRGGPSVPRVTNSIEPATVAPTVEMALPVIFPGYLLPDDALEARANEGG